MPFGSGFELFALVGVARMYSVAHFTDAIHTTGGSVDNQLIKDSSLVTYTATLGGGLSYQFAKQWAGQLMWQHYLKSGDIDAADLIAAGLRFHFA